MLHMENDDPFRKIGIAWWNSVSCNGLRRKNGFRNQTPFPPLTLSSRIFSVGNAGVGWADDAYQQSITRLDKRRGDISQRLVEYSSHRLRHDLNWVESRREIIVNLMAVRRTNVMRAIFWEATEFHLRIYTVREYQKLAVVASQH
jgi:hypothetical protein